MTSRPVPPMTAARRGVAIFGESVACGYALGALGGIIVAEAIALFDGRFDPSYALALAIYGGGVAAGVGLIVGLLVGSVLALVVSGCEARLGTRAVAHLIPVVALTITLPLAFLFGLIGGTVWVLAIVALDTTFTYAGARLLAHRYLRRTEGAPLH